MTHQPRQAPAPARRQPRPAEPAAPALSSDALLAGSREVLIRHGEEEYRLRLTGNNKLILTK